MGFEKKAPTTDMVVGLTKAEQTLVAMEDAIVTMRRGVKDQLVEAVELAEARKRENDQYEYDLQLKRRAVIDAHANEDRTREDNFWARSQLLLEYETELTNLLGMAAPVAGAHSRKEIIAAFHAKIAAVEKAAEGKGRGMADTEHKHAKALADAQAKTDLELLKAKHAQLEKENAALNAQNQTLLSAQTKSVESMRDLATKGLEASAAIQSRATTSLENAASNPLGGSPRRQ